MNARALVLIALLMGLFLLMAALIRWGESYRLNHTFNQKLAQRTSVSPQNARSPRGTLPGTQTGLRTLPTLPSAPLSPISPPRPLALATVQTRVPIASKVVTYLSQVSRVEQERQRTWQAWWDYLTPPVPVDGPGPTPPPLSPPALLATAAAWDQQLSKSLPDSECLAFHVAYLHYLALEKDYASRLTLLDQAGDRIALGRLQAEMQITLSDAATQVQAKLRTLQHDHPEFSPELQQLTIRAHTG